jgi:hypothetical protein
MERVLQRLAPPTARRATARQRCQFHTYRFDKETIITINRQKIFNTSSQRQKISASCFMRLTTILIYPGPSL